MKSSKSILKSTSLIGGASVIKIFLSIFKSKAVALILGPSGTGLIGALQSSVNVLKIVSSLGINNSAVRDIAQYNAKNDKKDLSITIKSMRKVVLFTGAIGLLFTLIFAKYLSLFTFDSTEYTLEIRILSISVFFNLISEGQSALVQGMRRIKDLAKMTVFSTLFSVIISLPILYFFEFDGVAYFLVITSIGQYIITFYYARKIKIDDVKVSLKLALQRSKSMIKLGFSFMGGALVTSLVAFLIRVIIIRDLGIYEAGIYQAAFALSGLYVDIILQAMGKDFYPRLTAVAYNSEKENELINEQTEVGMILAAPGLMFTLALAPLVIRLFYSAEYIEAYNILQWMILGIFLKTIVWPMGFVFIARAKGKMFFVLQVLAQTILLILTFLFINYYGLLGTGIAFFLMYCCHIIYVYFFVNRENQFSWSFNVLKTIIFLSVLFGIGLTMIIYLKQIISTPIILFFGIVLTYIAFLKIKNIFEIKNLKELILKIRNKF